MHSVVWRYQVLLVQGVYLRIPLYTYEWHTIRNGSVMDDDMRMPMTSYVYTRMHTVAVDTLR